MRGSWKAVAVGGMALLCAAADIAHAAEAGAAEGKEKAQASVAVPKG